MTNAAVAVDAGESGLLIMVNNNGLPKREVSRVTTALIIATNIGVSNFLAGFFSGAGAGGVGISREDGEGGSV